MPTSIVYKNYNNRIPLNTQPVTKANYSHYGWTDPSGNRYTTSNFITLTGNITLSAIWGVSITYYQDATANSPSHKESTVYLPTQTYDVLAGTNSVFSRFDVTGKTITGWTEGSPTGTPRAVGYTYTMNSNTTNITLYAVWADTNYRVSYYNAGTVPPYEETLPKDTLVTVRGRVMYGGTRIVSSSTSTFGLNGWATSSGGTVLYDPYSTTNTFTLRSDTTLHAVWATVTGYAVTYVVTNGGTAVTDSNSPYMSGKIVTVLANPTAAGYTFNKWQLNSSSTYYYYTLSLIHI